MTATRTRDAFLESALAGDSDVMPLDALRDWLDIQRATRTLMVRRVPFAALGQWDMGGAPCRLAHRSGRFFAVEGMRVTTDAGPVASWDQPIIRQDEIGTLGLLVRTIGGVRHFLMQAKIEPGNINGIQLSPTLQSTHSNQALVHGGVQPPYTRYFTQGSAARVLVDRILSEQGARFLNKRNRNVIAEVAEEVPLEPGFCWLTLGQIHRLLREDNAINMSARSVLSCIDYDPEALRQARADGALTGFGEAVAASLDPDSPACHQDEALQGWIDGLCADHCLHREIRPLNALDGWIAGPDAIRHESGRHFSVVAVAVEAVGREVLRWNQPLLRHSGRGLNGFLLQRIGGVLHILVRACLYPGNGHLFELGSTVSRANAFAGSGAGDSRPLIGWFRDPPPGSVRFRTMQSEEGGRFQQHVSSYMMVEVPETQRLVVPGSHRWMTVAQLQRWNARGRVTIEGRNLLACLALIA